MIEIKFLVSGVDVTVLQFAYLIQVNAEIDGDNLFHALGKTDDGLKVCFMLIETLGDPIEL